MKIPAEHEPRLQIHLLGGARSSLGLVLHLVHAPISRLRCWRCRPENERLSERRTAINAASTRHPEEPRGLPSRLIEEEREVVGVYVPAVERYQRVSIVARLARRGTVEVQTLHLGEALPQVPSWTQDTKRGADTGSTVSKRRRGCTGVQGFEEVSTGGDAIATEMLLKVGASRVARTKSR